LLATTTDTSNGSNGSRLTRGLDAGSESRLSERLKPRDPPPHRCRRDLPRPQQRHPLVGAVLAEQHDEWIEGRRYFGLDVLQRSRLTLISTPTSEEVSQPLTATAISA
jgi:hypothetical protein